MIVQSDRVMQWRTAQAERAAARQAHAERCRCEWQARIAAARQAVLREVPPSERRKLSGPEPQEE